MKKIILLLIVGIFSLSLISALDSLGTFKQGDCVEIKQTCASCSYTNISLSYPNSSIAISNIKMTSLGSGGWNASFCNNTENGRYDIIGIGDKDGVPSSFATYYEITSSGYGLSSYDSLVRIFLILFFILLFFGYYRLNEKVDYEKWHDKILKKYENRNYVKLILSSIGFNLIKNKFGNYYLICFPIVILLRDLSIKYNITTLSLLFEGLFIVYTMGIMIIAFMFFGQVQEFIMGVIEEANENSWGISKNDK